MLPVSYFNSALTSYPRKDADLIKLLHSIKSGYFKDEIERYRSGKILKIHLPAFTPAGTFKVRRVRSLVAYNGIIHLDFDKLTPTQLDTLRDWLKGNKFTFAFFVSPSGNGLKVFARSDIKPSQHAACVEQMRQDAAQNFHLEADAKCKDISRLCFVSHDTEAFINENSETLHFAPVALADTPKVNDAEVTVPAEAIKFLSDFTSKRFGNYEAGNRSNYIFYLACNCNRYGLDENEAIQVCSIWWFSDHSDFSYKQFLSDIKSAYKNLHEHGLFRLPNSLLINL